MSKKVTFENELSLNAFEREVITLKAVMDMVNNMVNHETMLFTGNSPHASVIFKTMTHKAFFNILLVDLLSVPNEFFNGDKSYIERLTDICTSPALLHLNPDANIEFLKGVVKSFSSWLSEIVTVEKRWFPSLDIEIDLLIERKSFITMCGNISKHNFTQLTKQAKKFQVIMKQNGHSISREKCLIALDDFYTQFYDDIFAYHAATIAEFLNNIRWGIYFYAVAEMQRSITRYYDDKMKFNNYKYEVPPQIESEIGREYYWNLMNDMLHPPYVERFQVSKYAKMHY